MPQTLRRPLLALLFLALAIPAAAAQGGTPLALDTYALASLTPDGYGYAPDHVIADTAGTLTFVNADLRAHDVIAVASGPSDNPWCDRYPNRDCPLFASALVGLGGEALVEGTAQLEPLASYEFYCSVHPFMRGTLTVV